MSRFHLTQTQLNLVEAFEGGDLGEVEFFESALDAGMPLESISEILAEMRIDLEIAGSGALK